MSGRLVPSNHCPCLAYFSQTAAQYGPCRKLVEGLVVSPMKQSWTLLSEFLEDPPTDLQQPKRQHEFLAGQVLKRRQALESRLRTEIEAANVAKRRARFAVHMRLWLALAVFIASLTTIILNVSPIFDKPTRDDWILLGAFGFLMLLSAALISRDVNPAITAWSIKKSMLRSLEEATHRQVGDVIREVINDRWAEETLWGLDFDSVSAPTMVGVTIDNAVSSAT